MGLMYSTLNLKVFRIGRTKVVELSLEFLECSSSLLALCRVDKPLATADLMGRIYQKTAPYDTS